MTIPLQRSTLTDLTADAILQLIEDRGLRSGDQIPATGELADTLQVSRPVVREAVASLAGLGILRRQQGRESVITVPGSTELSRMLTLRLQVQDGRYDGVQEFREVVEVATARLAARRATPEDIALLQERLEVLRSVDTDDALHDADVAFHRQVAIAGKNDLLILLLDSLAPLLRKLRTKAWAGWIESGGGLKEIVEAHAEILDYIIARDEAAAADAMDRHLGQARSGLESRSNDVG